jgi:hypothetical protein
MSKYSRQEDNFLLLLLFHEAVEGQKVDFCTAPDFKACSSFIID